MKRPYIALGCDQQGCVTPTKLRAAHLDRQIAAKLEKRTLPELLLAKGAMTGPEKVARSFTRWSLWLRRFHRALLALVLQRNH